LLLGFGRPFATAFFATGFFESFTTFLEDAFDFAFTFDFALAFALLLAI
jgi:hypothetical protein